MFLEKPELLERNSVVLVKNGETAELVCRASGIPAPTVAWFKGDEPVRSTL